ncbi:EthD family reductase [Cupriavidus necator]|uniref:EthD domain-containing protein n=1 Tax=Cupriavidus necator TaxID=106590 RepID=UPI0005B3FC08|nr:EthD family reductase [Cupriavidus necator]
MTVRMGLLNKKTDWSQEDFRRYWTEVHGPLAARLPGLRSYIQNHVIDTAQRGITYKRGPEHVDGFSDLTFENVDAMREAFASEVAPALAEDEARFIGRLRILTLDRREVNAPDPSRKLLKRMSFLRRRSDVDEATFEREWRVEHARLVKLMPGVAGYRQNLVVEREATKGTPCGYGELPIDGVVELWFTDPESLNAAFASPEGVRTMAHAQTFIDEITTFLVEPRVIVPSQA